MGKGGKRAEVNMVKFAGDEKTNTRALWMSNQG